MVGFEDLPAISDRGFAEHGQDLLPRLWWHGPRPNLGVVAVAVGGDSPLKAFQVVDLEDGAVDHHAARQRYL